MFVQSNDHRCNIQHSLKLTRKDKDGNKYIQRIEETVTAHCIYDCMVYMNDVVYFDFSIQSLGALVTNDLFHLLLLFLSMAQINKII